MRHGETAISNEGVGAIATASVPAERLGPLLVPLGRLIRAGGVVREASLRTLLVAAGLEPHPDLLAELGHWADLLRSYLWQSSPTLRDAVSESLARRGLPADLIAAVLDDLLTSAPAPSENGAAVAGDLTWAAPSPARAPRIPPVLSLLLPLVLLLGLILRVWLATTQSAWLDEAWSLQQMARTPLGDLYNTVKFSDTKSPLYYGLLHLWVNLIGFGVVQARLLSVLFGLAAIPVLYLLALRLYDQATALVAALLLAISPLATWYADGTITATCTVNGRSASGHTRLLVNH